MTDKEKAKQEDLETLNQGRPYIKSILAFILHLRHPLWEFQQCHTTAQKWVDTLVQDVKNNDV